MNEGIEPCGRVLYRCERVHIRQSTPLPSLLAQFAKREARRGTDVGRHTRSAKHAVAELRRQRRGATGMSPTPPRTLQMTILAVLADGGKQHKINMIGRPYQSGTLEAKLGVKFTADDRQ